MKLNDLQENEVNLLNGLLNNELFTLSLMGTLNKNKDDTNSQV